MIVVPAIDLKGGKCVRLLRGDMHAETIYGDDPLAIARRWVAAGAEVLHVVDLDGAVSGAPVNGETVAALCWNIAIPVQVGGGVRTVARAEELLGFGAARVIFGTAALADPDVVADACRRWPGRIAVGIDARDGMVAVAGWTETSRTAAVDLARRVEALGAARIIYTDIARDGTQQGANVAATCAIAAAVRIPVTASGGVGSLDDIIALRDCGVAGIDAVIVGRALYTGAVDLSAAVRVARGAAG